MTHICFCRSTLSLVIHQIVGFVCFFLLVFFCVVLQWLKSLKLFFNFSRVIVWAVSFGVSHSVMEMKWAVLQPLWLRPSGADKKLSHRWDNHGGYARNQVITDTYAIFQFLPLSPCFDAVFLIVYSHEIAFSQVKKRFMKGQLSCNNYNWDKRKPSRHKMYVKWLHTNKQNKHINAEWSLSWESRKLLHMSKFSL